MFSLEIGAETFQTMIQFAGQLWAMFQPITSAVIGIGLAVAIALLMMGIVWYLVRRRNYTPLR